MTLPNGTSNGTGSHAGVAGSRPVILVRYRPDVIGQTARIVHHLAPLPDGGQPSALTALCGIPLPPEDIEQVSVGEGMPCTLLVLLAGEPFPVALPWPPGVHWVATSLLLPPTMTPRGPLTWARSPHPTALALCREIDVLSALRTVQDLPPPTAPTAF
ncbi:MAG: hypothetical protein ACRDRM_11655 [Pseudonocardiaceae bacterium]